MRVLVAEDHELLGRSIATGLRREGMAVDLALKMGGKVVWFPTMSSGAHIAYHAEHRDSPFPTATVPVMPEREIDVLDDDDDVQTVWGNYEISDEVMEKLATFEAAGAEQLYLQVLDLSDLDHLELVAAEVAPQL